MTDTGSPADDALDFSHSETAASAPTCAGCRRSISDQYWTAGPAIICHDCQAKVAAGQSAPSSLIERSGRFSRALLFGFGGMLAGSTVWYLVMKVANLEIGLIAILLGWLVANGVLKGSGNRGGRRYQVLAVLLTYFGIGTAYLPFAVEASLQQTATTDAGGASTTGATAPEAASPAPRSTGFMGFLAGIAFLIWGILSLPVLTLSGTGAIISVLIYAFAIMKAWQLTAERRVAISGPFQIGATSGA